jgi:outer membrane lipoprotein SlyB
MELRKNTEGYEKMAAKLKKLNIFIFLFIIPLFSPLLSCSQKRPVLYPNSYLKHVGKEFAEADIDDCIQLAKDYGVDSKSGDRIPKQTAKGAAVGGATGAAVGAVTGNLGRGTAVGAAGGAAAAGTREALRSGDPDPVFKRFVEKCLRDKGYEPIGWR